MRLRISIEQPGDEPLNINVDDVAKLPDEQRLAVAKSLIVAAFRLCPKESSNRDCLDPAAVELARYMNSCVHALLRERQSAQFWDTYREQQDAIAAHGLN